MNEGTRGLWKVRALLFGDNVGTALRSLQFNMTNAQAKSFRATPVTIVAAQGAGKLIVPIACTISLVYGGTNAFVQGGAGDNFSLKLKDGSGAVLMSGGIGAFTQNTTSAFSVMVPGLAAGSSSNITKANGDNQPLVVHNQAAAELTGNAAADNTFVLNLIYTIIPSNV